MGRGRKRSRFCDCGEYVTTLGRRYRSTEPVCDRCFALDGKTDLEMDVISALREGETTPQSIAVAVGSSDSDVRAVLRRIGHRFKREWDTTHCDVPEVTTVRWAGLEYAELPDRGQWLGSPGRVVSGPLGDARFPGRRFPTYQAALSYYGARYTITARLRLGVPRYFFKVIEHEDAGLRECVHPHGIGEDRLPGETLPGADQD